MVSLVFFPLIFLWSYTYNSSLYVQSSFKNRNNMLQLKLHQADGVEKKDELYKGLIVRRMPLHQLMLK